MHWLAALLGLAVTAFTQLWLGRFVRSRAALLMGRTFLGVLGLAVGFVMARIAEPGSLDLALVLVGCGVVHAPAAVVLLLKHWRGEAPS